MHTLAPQRDKAHRSPSTAPGDRRAAAPPTRDLRRVVGNEAVSRLMAGEALTDLPADASMAAEYPVGFVGPLQPGDTRAVPHDFVGPLAPGVARSPSFHPTITVVTPGTRTSDCGGSTSKVRWGIPASESASSGWIVQKVAKTFEATDSAGNPVAPTPFDDPSNYPFWEAWEFTAGQNVWVGAAAGGNPHSGDTFSHPGDYPGTKGRKSFIGEVKAIVGFALPAGMTVRNAAPAWSLPYTRSEPALFAGTLRGATHTLTSEWDCTPAGTVTRATAVGTTP